MKTKLNKIIACSVLATGLGVFLGLSNASADPGDVGSGGTNSPYTWYELNEADYVERVTATGTGDSCAVTGAKKKATREAEQNALDNAFVRTTLSDNICNNACEDDGAASGRLNVYYSNYSTSLTAGNSCGWHATSSAVVKFDCECFSWEI